jgi:hypothetical protein
MQGAVGRVIHVNRDSEYNPVTGKERRSIRSCRRKYLAFIQLESSSFKPKEREL